MQRLSTADIAHLREEYARSIAPYIGLEEYGINDGPDVVMTSIGYVDLCTDGNVMANGRTLHTLDVDGIEPSERPDLGVLVDVGIAVDKATADRLFCDVPGMVSYRAIAWDLTSADGVIVHSWTCEITTDAPDASERTWYPAQFPSHYAVVEVTW